MRSAVREGVIEEAAALSERDPSQPAWEATEHRAWQSRRMEVYAAQVTRLDAGVGRIVSALTSAGRLDDTLIVFLSDNGASDETLPKVDLERFRRRTDILRTVTRDGREVRIGNQPSIEPGAEDTYASYGRAWANLSNAPFRYYKQWVHEGGIATPFIVHWPERRPPRRSRGAHALSIDRRAADAARRVRHRLPGRAVEGRSMLPALRGGRVADATLYWEHTGNAAVRHGQWKLVRQFSQPWELYDIQADRSELHDLAPRHPDLVADLAADWQAWADRVGVIPWSTTLNLYRTRGLTDEEAAG